MLVSATILVGATVSLLFLVLAWYARKCHRDLKHAGNESSEPNKLRSDSRDKWARAAATSALLAGLPLAFAIHLSDYAPLRIVEAYGTTATAIAIVGWITTHLGKLPVGWAISAFYKPELWRLCALALIGFLGGVFALTLVSLLASETYREVLLRAVGIAKEAKK